MAAGLLTAGAGHAWETDVVAALDRPGAPLTVVRRCVDIADVLATASTGQASACLLAADLRRLDSDSVQQLESFGVAVVGVHAAGDQWAPVRLDRIGVTAVVAEDAGTDDILAAVQRAMAGGGASPGAGRSAPRSTADPRWALGSPAGGGHATGGPGAAGPGGVEQQPGVRAAGPDGGIGDPNGSSPPDGPAGAPPTGWFDGPPVAGASAGAGPPLPNPDSAAPFGYPGTGGTVTAPPPGSAGAAAPGPARAGDSAIPPAGRDREPMLPGSVVAVWGPGGAPGRSTVAMGLADRAAAEGRSVLLVDADVYGGVLANAFGMLDESPGLAGACRLAANGRLDTAELSALCWTVGDGFAVLTGIARADRWPEVRPSAIPAVLGIARQLAELVVVDCAAVLETDEEISFDTMAPRRNGATLAVLDEADTVLAVGSADPPGMERLVRGLAELAAAVDGPAPRVVLNRVRRTAASAGELAAAVRRFAGADPEALLPEDRAACDRAWQRGVTLSVAAPKSSLTAGLTKLARAVLPVAAGVRREP